MRIHLAPQSRAREKAIGLSHTSLGFTAQTPPGTSVLFAADGGFSLGCGFEATQDGKSLSTKQKNALLRAAIQTLLGNGGSGVLDLSQDDVKLLVKISLSNINPSGTCKPNQVMSLIDRTYPAGTGTTDATIATKRRLALQFYVASQNQSRWFKSDVTRTATRMLHALYVNQAFTAQEQQPIKKRELAYCAKPWQFAIWVMKCAQIPDQSGKQQASLKKTMIEFYGKYVNGSIAIVDYGILNARSRAQPRFCLLAGTTRVQDFSVALFKKAPTQAARK